MKQRRIPKSSRGEETRQTLVESAAQLFLNEGYHKTSVLGIARRAKTSPAAFYQYFRSKDEVFGEILQVFQEESYAKVKAVLLSGEDLPEMLQRLIDVFFDTIWEQRSAFKSFREAEFIDLSLASSFHRNLCDVLGKTLAFSPDTHKPLVTLWFLMGPLFFTATYWIQWKGLPVPQQVRQTLHLFFLRGISPVPFYPDRTCFSIHQGVEGNETASGSRGEKTKEKLMRSAESLFGKKGYNETSINEIATLSGVSVGTFYTYFHTKKELLRTLVEQTSRSLRHFLHAYTCSFSDRRNQELAAYVAFLVYFSQHAAMYAIVREAEFIDPQIARNYYKELQDSYHVVLQTAMDRGQIRPLTVPDLSLILMGIGHWMGHSLLILSNTTSEGLPAFVEKMAPLLFHGLEGQPSEALVRKTEQHKGGKKR